MYDISLCLAGIRPHFWRRLYDSAVVSCSRYAWEMVIISPFDLLDDMKNLPNVKHIQEWGCPVRASQRGVTHCEGRLLTFPCDDGVFMPDGLNQSIDLYNAVAKPKDGIVMRYREGANMGASTFPDSYWMAKSHLGSSIIVEDHWKIAPQPMLSLSYYKELGGVDCASFQCMAFATHDLCYRMQRDGGVFHLSPIDVMNADHYGNTGVDHAPIYYGQTEHDQPMFYQMYSDQSVINRIHVDFNEWQKLPEVWSRRWGDKKL